MLNEQDTTPLKDTILMTLRDKKIHMRPRAYFIARMVALAAIGGALLVSSIFIANYLSFVLRATDHIALISLGWHGFLVSFLLFPWWTLALMLLLVFLFERVARTFSWGYRTPVVYLLAGALMCITVLGVVMDYTTSVNQHLFEGAERNELPVPLNDLYRNARPDMPQGDGVFRVVVLSVDGGTVLVRNDSDSHAPTTTLSFGPDGKQAGFTFLVGDRVYIDGDKQNDIISVSRYVGAPQMFRQ